MEEALAKAKAIAAKLAGSHWCSDLVFVYLSLFIGNVGNSNGDSMLGKRRFEESSSSGSHPGCK